MTWLAPGEAMPGLRDHEPWILLETRTSGEVVGSGFGHVPTGEAVAFERVWRAGEALAVAVAAAEAWAQAHAVAIIFVSAHDAR